jgi:hypothetical protein
MGRGNRWDRQRRRERGRGRETLMGKVLLSSPQEVMITLVPWPCSGRKKMYEEDLDTEG